MILHLKNSIVYPVIFQKKNKNWKELKLKGKIAKLLWAGQGNQTKPSRRPTPQTLCEVRSHNTTSQTRRHSDVPAGVMLYGLKRHSNLL